MGEDDLFDIFPDMDLDGDHDLIDFLILDDIENEIQKEIEENSSHHINVNLDDLVDDDIYIEYGIDREDYATREEYLEAVREARYGWRDEVEVRIELGLDPYDYETEDEYNEAFEEAEEKYGWRTYATGGFDYGISALDFETEDDYYAAVDEWCIDTFLPYIQYADYKNDLTHAILLDINNFVDEFPSVIVDYMVNNPNFTSKLILGCTDSLWCIEDFVVIALKGGHTKTAIDIMRCAFSNPHTNVGDKARFISACIDECSNWDEVETIELFREHIFPITFNETDVRITNKIPRWQNAMAEYVESMERDCDKYAYSRVNSWRAQYRNADINPIHYENEDEYLEAVTERKYGWRKHCTNKFGIDPNTFETRAEYDLAISAEYEKERRIRKQERLANAKDSRLYSFCKVSISYPDKPHYYYLTGNVKLHVGDTVIVPFGSDNTEIHATVVAVGECLGANFPCAINRIKQVKEKVE